MLFLEKHILSVSVSVKVFDRADRSIDQSQGPLGGSQKQTWHESSSEWPIITLYKYLFKILLSLLLCRGDREKRGCTAGMPRTCCQKFCSHSESDGH